LQVQQGAVWDSLLSLSPEQPQQMMLSISLKHKQLLTNKSGAAQHTLHYMLHSARSGYLSQEPTGGS
jgi:hypothetical protein